MESSNDFRKEKSALEDPGHETGRAQNLCFFHNSKVCELKLNEKLARCLLRTYGICTYGRKITQK